MNILIITYCLDNSGSQILAMSLSTALAKKGQNVYLFNQYEGVSKPESIKTHLSSDVKLLTLSNYKLLNKLCWNFNKLFKGLGVDMVERMKDKLLDQEIQN